jgi:hypothetical protein
MPQLRTTIRMPGINAKLDDGESPPLVEHNLKEHPEISSAYERYRPSWEVWSAEYRRRERIQVVYAELFRMHTQLRKQGEIVELVLGVGLLDWRRPGKGKASPIRRHIVTGRVDLQFDSVTGMIRLDAPADGAQLRIEDDMLEAELRPERGYYASVAEQLSAIDDEIWDHASMHTALKSWGGALHADTQWSANLKPGTDGEGRPMLSFAPALILRKRTHAGMVRIYEALIAQLINEDNEVPPGWTGLIEDEDDQGDSRSPAQPDHESELHSVDTREIYFPLPAHREAERALPQPGAEGDLFGGGDRMRDPEIPLRVPTLPFAAYAVYNGPAGEDPRTVNAGSVAEGLCRIIETEGPMLAKRAYDIYLRGCGIKRMGHELKSTMNKALANAIRQGRVISEDESGKRGLLFSVVRVKESPPIKLRSRGPRTFEEIPPSELLTVANYLGERRNFKSGSDEHLRAVLECFDLKRLTAQTESTLLQILEKSYPYIDDVVMDMSEKA